MSLDSVRREEWIEIDEKNLGKFNRWITSCHGVVLSREQLERNKYNVIKWKRRFRILKTNFRDWKILALCCRRTQRVLVRRVFGVMVILRRYHLFMNWFNRIFDFKELSRALRRWKKNIDNRKESHRRRRWLAGKSLREVGCASRLMKAIICSFRRLWLRRRFLEWCRLIKAMSKLSDCVASAHLSVVQWMSFEWWRQCMLRRRALVKWMETQRVSFLRQGLLVWYEHMLQQREQVMAPIVVNLDLNFEHKPSPRKSPARMLQSPSTDNQYTPISSPHSIANRGIEQEDKHLGDLKCTCM